MQERYRDNDLREALKRKYADTPQLPADFMEKMKERMENHEGKEHDSKPKHRTAFMVRWIAAAASLLLLIGIGITMLTTDSQTEPETLTAQNVQATPRVQDVQTAPQVQTAQATPSVEKPSTNSRQSGSPKGTDSQSEAGGLAVRSGRTEPKQPVVEQQEATIEALDTESDIDPNLHYASNEAKTDTVPYQDPARMDDFIAKMADYFKVKEGELKCSSQNDSTIISAVYVFPDIKEVDVFGRLLQAACWYSDETPGYLLSFSHQQFFFELKDLHCQLHYRWIAERVNGKILLYSTQAPMDTKVSSACYQEYRDELMHIKSINNKTRKI